MFGHGLTDFRLRHTRRLALTALEARCVPATTWVMGANRGLNIFDDDGSHKITITQVGAIEYWVDGLTDGSHYFPGITSIAVRTGGGTDEVILNGQGGPSDLRYVTVVGGGALTVTNDRFNVHRSGNFSVGVPESSTKDVSVFVGAGTDLGSGFSVRTGAGNDAVSVGSGVRVRGKTEFFLGGGENQVRMAGATIDGSLTVYGGGKNDTVVLTGVTLTDANARANPARPPYLDLNLGGGSDKVTLTNVTVKGPGGVTSTSGSLALTVAKTTVKGYLHAGGRELKATFKDQTEIGGRLWLITEGPPPKAPNRPPNYNDPNYDPRTDPRNNQGNLAGDDVIEVSGCRIASDLRVNTGRNTGSVPDKVTVKGTTVGGHTTVAGQAGVEVSVGGATLSGNLNISCTTGDAAIYLKSSEVKGALYIRTGAGGDVIGLRDVTIGQANWYSEVIINTGGGDSVVDLGNSTFYAATVKIDGGAAKDELDLGSSTFLGHVQLNGGPGSDTLRAARARFRGTPLIWRFYEDRDVP